MRMEGANPVEIEIPEDLKEKISEIRSELEDQEGNLSDRKFQRVVKNCLMRVPEWSDWVTEVRRPIGLKPYVVKSGLGIERDDETAKKTLVGLALCMEPHNFVAPYSIENRAVTEVIAQSGSTPESHSMNDLPAPPHTAGFFEDVPPHTCYFACIRSHPNGGGETTVLNIESILEKASPALIDEWRNRSYRLRTSTKLGSQVRGFSLLDSINGIPFLRYRKEYTVDFENDESLIALEKLVCDLSNHYVVRLEPGETILHWNGAPHSRLSQLGSTPSDVVKRRKLIRCRTQPRYDWNEKFIARN